MEAFNGLLAKATTKTIKPLSSRKGVVVGVNKLSVKKTPITERRHIKNEIISFK